MLTPEQIEGFRLAAGRLIDPVNTYLLKDIARRIQEAGPAPRPMKHGRSNGSAKAVRSLSGSCRSSSE